MHQFSPGAVPEYDELPVLDTLGMRHSWDFFGRDDQYGTLNFLTSSVITSALSEATEGVVVSLNLPITEPSPPLFGREPTTHTFFTHDRNTWDDRLDAYFPQGSSQWDGFRHVRAREFGFFGGQGGDPATDKSWLGIDQWARRGIVGRGVLADVGHFLQEAGAPLQGDIETKVTTELLSEVLEAQGTEIRHGDLLVVRTGWPTLYRSLSGERRAMLNKLPCFPGLFAGEQTARWLWNLHVSALITDVPAVESVPGNPQDGSLHRRLLPLLGLPLGELFDLDELSTQCRGLRRSNFLIVSAPVNLPGGCGSPSNALAIF